MYDLFELAVLRGVCDGDAGKYFGSTMNLLNWIARAKAVGLLTTEGTPTEEGLRIYREVLSVLPNGRATFWCSKALTEIKD